MKILSFADYKHLLKKLVFSLPLILVPQVLFICPLYTQKGSSLSKRFFCSRKERKRTEVYYWKLYSNYQIAELVTLPTGNDPDL